MVGQNPRAFISGIVIFGTAIILSYVIGWQAGGLLDAFYNNSYHGNPIVPQGLIDKASTSDIYTEIEDANVGPELWFINLFWLLDYALYGIGAYFLYQGAFVEQGVEVEAGRRFGRP